MTGPLRSVLALRRLIGNIRRMGRVSRYISFVAVTAALLVPMTTGAAAKEPLRLKPSSKWNVHYAADSCRMVRSFGEGDQKVTLLADRFEPGDSLRLSFVGKPVNTRHNEGTIELRFGPTEEVQKILFYPALFVDKSPALMLREDARLAPRTEAEYAAYEAALKGGDYGFQWSKITPEQEAAVTFIEVKRSVREPFILETGSLGPPFEAMRKCTDELLNHWGIDVAKHATLSRPVTPTGNPAKWMKSSDYPPAMLAAGRRAIVQFRLNVDAGGVPTACHIQQSTRPKEFDDAVCKAIMRNAKFTPALDADGNPIVSYWLNTVIFQM